MSVSLLYLQIYLGHLSAQPYVGLLILLSFVFHSALIVFDLNRNFELLVIVSWNTEDLEVFRRLQDVEMK